MALGQVSVGKMLASMTSRELAEWRAFFIAENEPHEEPESAKITALGLSEHAERKLREKLSKQRRTR